MQNAPTAFPGRLRGYRFFVAAGVSVEDCAIRHAASVRPRLDVRGDSENGQIDGRFVEVGGGDEGFDGRRIHVPLFAEARSIASNSVSLKRQPSASRLALA